MTKVRQGAENLCSFDTPAELNAYIEKVEKLVQTGDSFRAMLEGGDESLPGLGGVTLDDGHFPSHGEHAAVRWVADGALDEGVSSDNDGWGEDLSDPKARLRRSIVQATNSVSERKERRESKRVEEMSKRKERYRKSSKQLNRMEQTMDWVDDELAHVMQGQAPRTNTTSSSKPSRKGKLKMAGTGVREQAGKAGSTRNPNSKTSLTPLKRNGNAKAAKGKSRPSPTSTSSPPPLPPPQLHGKEKASKRSKKGNARTKRGGMYAAEPHPSTKSHVVKRSAAKQLDDDEMSVHSSSTTSTTLGGLDDDGNIVNHLVQRRQARAEEMQKQQQERENEMVQSGMDLDQAKTKLRLQLDAKAFLIRALTFTGSLLQRAMDSIEPGIEYMARPDVFTLAADAAASGDPALMAQAEAAARRPRTPAEQWKCKECAGCANLVGKMAEEHELLLAAQEWADELVETETRNAGALFRETVLHYTQAQEDAGDTALLQMCRDHQEDTALSLWSNFVGEEKLEPMWMVDEVDVDFSIAAWVQYLHVEHNAFKPANSWEDGTPMAPLYNLSLNMDNIVREHGVAECTGVQDVSDARRASMLHMKDQRKRKNWKAMVKKADAGTELEDRLVLRAKEQAKTRKKKKKLRMESIKRPSVQHGGDAVEGDSDDVDDDETIPEDLREEMDGLSMSSEQVLADANSRISIAPGQPPLPARKKVPTASMVPSSDTREDQYQKYHRQEAANRRRRKDAVKVRTVAGLPVLDTAAMHEFDFGDDASPMMAGMAATFQRHGDGSALDYIAQFCLLDDYKLRLFKIVFDKTAVDGDMNAAQLEKGLRRVHRNGISKKQIGIATILLDFVQDGVLKAPSSTTGTTGTKDSTGTSETSNDGGGVDMVDGLRVDFKVFCVLAAISEQLVTIHPSMVKMLTKTEPGALRTNLKKAKDWFMHMFMQNDTEKVGTISLDDLELELRAGRADPQVITLVVDTLRLQGLDDISFLDYLTYLPMFAHNHEEVLHNPLRMSVATSWGDQELPNNEPSQYARPDLQLQMLAEIDVENGDDSDGAEH